MSLSTTYKAYKAAVSEPGYTPDHLGNLVENLYAHVEDFGKDHDLEVNVDQVSTLIDKLLEVILEASTPEVEPE